ncbi:hypothetical protein [Tropicimonas sp. IMCC34043]|uniref:hypothetical protein n=1 Tax=Tropicimonas sp. IMCC34043 TaxID=2248760 RepID=UPI000E272BC6|nr:hypothetical protein [Tropicimonas sp. IMCC34043]
MNSLRRLLFSLLVLTLGLSTHAVGMARGQMPAAGEIVLCTGQGVVTISVDDRGNPVERHTLCPENSATLLAAVALPAPALPVLPVVHWRRARPVVLACPQCGLARTRHARAPPV